MAKIIPEGPEQPSDRILRKWFDEQEKRNVDRLDETAKLITQLVTGLYSVLFAILVFKDDPKYLGLPAVQSLGILSVLAFFVSLLAALTTVFPFHQTYQENNLSDMQRIYELILKSKRWGLRIALIAFLLGTGFLLAMIISVLRSL